jgi:hypothetical protein
MLLHTNKYTKSIQLHTHLVHLQGAAALCVQLGVEFDVGWAVEQ